MIPLNMKSIMYINIYLILTRTISNQKKFLEKIIIIIITIIINIGIQGSMIISKMNIINQKLIIIIMEEKEVIQEIVTEFKEVEAKVEVIVINIIINIANINIEMIIIELIVQLKKIYQIKKNHILHQIQNLIHLIQILLRVLLIQINLPCYIPIQ